MVADVNAAVVLHRDALAAEFVLGGVSVLETMLIRPSCFQTSVCGAIATSETLPKESSPYGRSLGAHHQKPLFFLKDTRLRPDPKHFAWHRKHRFTG